MVLLLGSALLFASVKIGFFLRNVPSDELYARGLLVTFKFIVMPVAVLLVVLGAVIKLA
jgi:hypothetical protein